MNAQDPLPKSICMSCHLQLEKSLLFRNKSKNSDSKLRRHIRLINAGKVSKVFDDSEDEFEDDYTDSIQIIEHLEEELNQKSIEIEERMREAIEKERKIIYDEAKRVFDEQLQMEIRKIEQNAAASKTESNMAVKRLRSSQDSDEAVETAEESKAAEDSADTEDKGVDSQIGNDQPETLIEYQVLDPFEEVYFENEPLKNQSKTVIVDTVEFEGNEESMSEEDVADENTGECLALFTLCTQKESIFPNAFRVPR